MKVKKVKRFKPALFGPAFFCLGLFIVLFAYGCAPTQGTARMSLYPSEKHVEGYSSSGYTWKFTDKQLLVDVRGYEPGPGAAGVEENLYARGYVLVKMGIKNLSEERVIYNPANTSLRDNTLGYKKPLDFTDLYDMASESEKIGGLTGFAKRFYDLSVTIMPGEKTERLLAFRPFDDNRVKNATLVVKGVYVGTEVVDLGFTFDLKAIEGP